MVLELCDPRHTAGSLDRRKGLNRMKLPPTVTLETRVWSNLGSVCFVFIINNNTNYSTYYTLHIICIDNTINNLFVTHIIINKLE